MTIPWLTLIGMDAGGFASLTPDACAALRKAPTIMGPSRHLSLLPNLPAQKLVWPVPFQAGIDQLLAMRGQPVAVLVSGDPFWFGAGSQLVCTLDHKEWLALPGRSCFSLAASALGWALDSTACLGLHAAPLTRLRPYLSPGRRLFVTLRDGQAVQDLADYMATAGFAQSQLTVLEKLAGPEQTVTVISASDTGKTDFQHPVMVGVEVAGEGRVMPHSSGLSDDWFAHDGQLTKQPVRAATLAALAPQPGQYLWDLGAGSGSVAIEWLLSGPAMQATAVEQNPDRAASIAVNAVNLGVDWLQILHTDNLSALEQLGSPDAVFIGGGLRDDLLRQLWERLPVGTRLVANGVTIETDRLLTGAQETYGGQLTRFQLSALENIGQMSGWKAAFPITQWAVTR